MSQHLARCSSLQLLCTFVLLLGLLSARAQAQNYKALAASVLSSSPMTVLGSHAGTPYNDLVEYLPRMGFVSGETGGFDTFYPVSCSGEFPGANEVITVECCQSPDYDLRHGGARGDRVILGTARHGVFFRRGADSVDNDYCHITSFDYGSGFIQLAGDASWYHLEHCTADDDGTTWDGWALFDTHHGTADLIAFIDDCVSSYRTTSSGIEPLDLNNSAQFRYAQPIHSTVQFPAGHLQLGTVANDSAVAITADDQGNLYVTGHSEGDINPGDGLAPTSNKAWIASYGPSGARRWLRTFPLGGGGSTRDIVTDNTYLYAVGRDWRGPSARFDAFIWRLDCATGSRIAEDLHTSTELDGYGNVTVHDDMLYVSGQGGVPNGYDYLIAAHRASDLGNAWRRFYNPSPQTNTRAAEAWGGIAIAPFLNRVFTAGWWFSPSSGFDTDGWAGAYDADTGNLAWNPHADIDSANAGHTEWSLGSAVDSLGNYYVAGFTTGNLGAIHEGEGDLFIRKYAADGAVLWTRQWGTPYTDSLRRLIIDRRDTLYAVGYTHGDLVGSNRDASHRTADIYIARMDSNGTILSERQMGTPEEDRGYPWVGEDLLYVAATTEGSLAGANQGACDAFVLRLSAQTLEPVQTAPRVPRRHLSRAPAVGVSPATVTLLPGATQQFTATVTGATNTAVTWSVQETGGGTVTPTGLYTAPGTAGTYHVVATSVADPGRRALATVTVAPTAQPYPVGLSDASLVVGGVTRAYRVHAPANLPSPPTALVLVLHGGGGEGLDVANTGAHPLSVFRTVADREGFVVVYPGGLPAKDGKPGWDDCRGDNLMASGADDLGFLDALIARVRGEYGLPVSRVFMCGGSNGAQMTLAYSVTRSTNVAAVATGSGNLPLTPKPGTCSAAPSRPVPILMTHGTADTMMPYDGGCVANIGGACNRGRVIGAEATRDYWLAVNGLTGVTPTQTVIDLDTTDGGPANRFVYAGAVPVEWWCLDGAGHTAASRTVLVPPSPLTGIQNRDVELAEIAWAFFKSRLPMSTPPTGAVTNTGSDQQ